jgi:tripartite-type tricarboxylate transporter receptor subunit TctC
VSLTWMSFAGPAGMPVEIARKWHEELQRIVKMPDVQARFANLGFEAWASSPEEMRQQMESEMVHWGEVIKRTGAQSD